MGYVRRLELRNNMRVAGQVALVTGSSRGIGASIAKELARAGARLIINYSKTEASAEAVVAEVHAIGSECWSYGFDVGDPVAVRTACDEIQVKHGPIAILVNNAGILRDRSFKRMTLPDWNDVLRINLNGAMNTCAAIIESMTVQKYGRIVNIASVVAQTGNFGQTNYAAAKAGLIGFSRSLALEVARTGITVNCICPGFIETEMWWSIPNEVRQALIAKIPLGRVGLPEDVARAVRFIVQYGDYITGQTINVNGGVFIG